MVILYKQIGILVDAPEMQSQLVSAHGMLAILEVLEAKKPHREVTTKLLQIINLVRLPNAWSDRPLQ